MNGIRPRTPSGPLTYKHDAGADTEKLKDGGRADQ